MNLISKQAADKLVKARSGLILTQPFFGNLALHLQFKEDMTHPTAWTDGKHMGYNPKFIDDLSLDLTKSVIAHEVMHLVLQHHSRKGDRDHMAWNKAGDYVVNELLDKADFALSEDWLRNRAYDDMTTEQVYAALSKNQQEMFGGNKPGNDQSGNNSGDGNGSGCGSGQQPQFDPDQMPGEVREPPPSGDTLKATKDDLKRSENQWKTITIQAAVGAKSSGQLPGEFERFIEAEDTGKIHWREILRDFVTDKIKSDTIWAVPNRRYCSQGVYLPSPEAMDNLCKAICYVDNSGSVYDSELKAFAEELTGILDEYPNIELTVKFFDTRVPDYEQTFTADNTPVQLKPVGGGGTDFLCIFKDVKTLEEEPKFLMIFTDMGDYDYPSVPPDFPVLWIATEEGYGDAPFGEMIKLYEYDN